MASESETISGTDFSWDDLLLYIEAGETVPVIGPELLTGRDGITLYERLAAELAKGLKISPSSVSDPKSLNMVIVESDHFRKGRQMIYPRLKGVLEAVLKSGEFPIPDPLLKLAEIKPFQLFLSTTFDRLLQGALDRVRYGTGNGNNSIVGGGTAALAYTPGRFDDLPVDWAEKPRPTVFQLFGRAGVAPTDYAATDGDLLEWLHAMQSREGRPERLFKKLRDSNLLFLGVGFSDWLARFFLRVARDKQLLDSRGTMEILADSRLSPSDSLVYFCQRFSSQTSVYEGGAVQFIDELHDRWRSRVSAQAVSQVAAEPLPGDDMEPGAVFISYASEDRAQAERVKQSLENTGLEVWYDRDRLQAGHFYEERIRHHVRQCSLFVPIISKTAQEYDGFFRKEWFWAGERVSEFYGAERPFIMPVCIDETSPEAGRLPEAFKAVQWMTAPGGELKKPSIEQVCQGVARSQETRARKRMTARVDAQHPWPGLVSFEEINSEFFFGRETEIAELEALVASGPVSVLFGRSGLGKTSLLRAGVFPRLRAKNFLPIYVRLNFSEDAPPLVEQVKQVLLAGLQDARVEAPRPDPQETLWEYCHREDVDFWDSRIRLITPILVFDQFEEIFTLGLKSQAILAGTAKFREELEALINNVPPEKARDDFKKNPELVGRFDFDKRTIKVLISLREDYLPDLDALRRQFHGLGHNRMRLQPMTGRQAREVILKPGQGLVDEAVADRIIEFVSRDRNLRDDEPLVMEGRTVEPALLSVVCRELNQRRLDTGQAAITAEILSGAKEEILNEFMTGP